MVVFPADERHAGFGQERYVLWIITVPPVGTEKIPQSVPGITSADDEDSLLGQFFKQTSKQWFWMFQMFQNVNHGDDIKSGFAWHIVQASPNRRVMPAGMFGCACADFDAVPGKAIIKLAQQSAAMAAIVEDASPTSLRFHDDVKDQFPILSGICDRPNFGNAIVVEVIVEFLRLHGISKLEFAI